MRRFYLLNGKEIEASECDGFLHRAMTPRGNCMACGKAVNTNQQYVILNYYDCPDPLHLECFIADHPEHTILGVKIEKRKRFLLLRTYVICKDYSRKKS